MKPRLSKGRKTIEKSVKMISLAVASAAAVGGMAVAGGALSSEEPATAALLGERLSAAQLAGLRGQADPLPPYCQAFYTEDPLTGQLICDAVVCHPPRGVASIHECFEFGL